MTSQSNVDPVEIEKFAAIAEQWWDINGDMRPLHLMNPTRLSYINQRCNGLFGKKVLDVGCGGGILAESMAKMGGDVLGVDMAEQSLNIGRLHALEHKVDIKYQQVLIEELAAEQPGSYDVVTCMEMLEHVPDPASVVAACARLVKPGGDLFFSTLNRNIKSYLLAIVAAERILKLVPKSTHQHDKFIKPSELIRFVDDNDCQCVDAIGIHYNPLTEQFKINQDLSVNYILHCRPL